MSKMKSVPAGSWPVLQAFSLWPLDGPEGAKPFLHPSRLLIDPGARIWTAKSMVAAGVFFTWPATAAASTLPSQNANGRAVDLN
jgi:hypothetical protein